MIRTELEYRRTAEIVAATRARIASERTRLSAAGTPDADVDAHVGLLAGTVDDLNAELQAYERLRAGGFEALREFEHIGDALVGLRIASGMSQRALARTLGIHESQVSRDERYAYRGATVERVTRVLAALGFRVQLTFTSTRPGVSGAGGTTPTPLA